MLTDTQMTDLAKRMDIPLAFIGFKSDLPSKIEANKSYVVNLEDALSKDGTLNNTRTGLPSAFILTHMELVRPK